MGLRLSIRKQNFSDKRQSDILETREGQVAQKPHFSWSRVKKLISGVRGELIKSLDVVR